MNLAPEVMKEIFEIAECLYALKNELKIKSKKIHSVRYGIETVFTMTLKYGNPLNFSNQKLDSLKLPLQNLETLPPTSWLCANCGLNV